MIPPGEAFVGIEATKGNNGYYLVSDGNTMRLPHAHSHALVSAYADDPFDQPRADDSRLDRDSGQHRFRHGGRGPITWTLRGTMLSEQERREIEADCAALSERPRGLHRCAEDRAAASRLGIG